MSYDDLEKTLYEWKPYLLAALALGALGLGNTTSAGYASIVMLVVASGLIVYQRKRYREY